MASIRYIGLNNLKPDEKEILKTILEGESYRIERMLPDIKEMVIDIKTLKPEDKKTRRHILNAKVISPLHTFMTKIGESDLKRSGSYDLTLACHIVMKTLAEEIRHKLKADMAPWKKKSEACKFAKDE